jgi:hypothetical protein
VASTNDVTDAEALPDLLQDVPGEIEQVSADGTYDQRRCYERSMTIGRGLRFQDDLRRPVANSPD